MSASEEDEKGTNEIRTLGGVRQLLVVTEPGLYKLIFQSRKPEAKKFQRSLDTDEKITLTFGESNPRAGIPHTYVVVTERLMTMKRLPSVLPRVIPGQEFRTLTWSSLSA